MTIRFLAWNQLLTFIHLSNVVIKRRLLFMNSTYRNLIQIINYLINGDEYSRTNMYAVDS